MSDVVADVERVIADAYKVAALYQFKALENPTSFCGFITDECKRRGVVGALILAREGINGTIAGRPDLLDQVITILKEQFNDMVLKFSYSQEEPFNRLRIRVKNEIVTMGMPLVDDTRDLSDISFRGEYVSGKEWNELISDPSVKVIDTRNDYEVSIGSFTNAIDPNTKTFRDFPDYVQDQLPLHEYKHQKIAMFCTGGVRCEKASAYMKSLGYKSIYHLKGGILQYLEDIQKDENLFEGSCFVFDRRTSVEHGLAPGKHKFCFVCRHPLSWEEIEQDPCFKEGVQCKYCVDVVSDKKRENAANRQRQIQIAQDNHEKHLGRQYLLGNGMSKYNLACDKYEYEKAKGATSEASSSSQFGVS